MALGKCRHHGGGACRTLAAPGASPEKRIANLELKVKNLDRRVRQVSKVLDIQIKLNRLTSQQLDLAGSRIDNANRRIDIALNQIALLQSESHKPSISVQRGFPALVAPRSSNSSRASCIGGDLIAGGFHSTQSIEVGASYPELTGWTVWGYNPYTQGYATLTAFAVCADWD
jgi:hypothetical protein